MCELNDAMSSSSRFQRLSSDGQKVYLALCQKYQTKQNVKKDAGKSYYASIYSKQYGASGLSSPCHVSAGHNIDSQATHPVGSSTGLISPYFIKREMPTEDPGTRKRGYDNEWTALSSGDQETENIFQHITEEDLIEIETPFCSIEGEASGAIACTSSVTVPDPNINCYTKDGSSSSSNVQREVFQDIWSANESTSPVSVASKEEGMVKDIRKVCSSSKSEKEKHAGENKCVQRVFDIPKKTNITKTQTQATMQKMTKQKPRKSFSTPVKKTSKTTNSGPQQSSISSYFGIKNQVQLPISTRTNGDERVTDLLSMNSTEIKSLLESTSDFGLTLIYSDKSSQLREPVKSGKRKSSLDEDVTVKSLLIACLETMGNSTDKRFISVNLEKKQSKELKWDFISTIMSSKGTKICFDAQELISVLLEIFGDQCSKVCTDWVIDDPKLAAWLLFPDDPPATFSQLVTSNNIQFHQKSFHEETEPCCTDLLKLCDIMKQLNKKLDEAGLMDLFKNVESKLIPLLSALESRHLLVDMGKLKEFGSVLSKKLIRLETKAYESAGQRFVLTSTQQLRQILFEHLKLDTKLPGSSKMARTASGNHKSTCESVLKTLSSYHTLPDIILQHRQLQKLKSTYVDGILTYVINGHLSTHWDHTSAATGRLTSTNPNIQAIPKTPVPVSDYEDNFIIGKESIPYLIYAREIFVAKEGWSFISADFCQIELRLLAHFSGDAALLKVFQDDQNSDIFKELTSQWLDKPIGDVNDTDRERTKRVVYSIMYGVGKKTLGEYLSVKPEDASAIMQSFLAKFAGVNKFTSQCISLCKFHGYTRTLFNRRRMFPQISSQNHQLRTQSERQAVNFCIQGSAADLCKSAMLHINDVFQRKELKARLLVQIHDELLFESPDEELRIVKDLVRGVMEDKTILCKQALLKVPLRVAIRNGKSWAHMS